MSDTGTDGDFYVYWTSTAGALAIHGPYPHVIAQTLRAHAPVPGAQVVRASDGDAAFAITAAYLLSGHTAPYTALTSAGIGHVATTHTEAVHTALAHVLADAPQGLQGIAAHLAHAGFRAHPRP